MAQPAQESGLNPRSNEGEIPQIAGWFILWKIPKKNMDGERGYHHFRKIVHSVAFKQPFLFGARWCQHGFSIFRNKHMIFHHQTWGISQETTIGSPTECPVPRGRKAWCGKPPPNKLWNPCRWFPWVGNCKNQSNQGHFFWDKSSELRSCANWRVSPIHFWQKKMTTVSFKRVFHRFPIIFLPCSADRPKSRPGRKPPARKRRWFRSSA